MEGKISYIAEQGCLILPHRLDVGVQPFSRIFGEGLIHYRNRFNFVALGVFHRRLGLNALS
jgi:hypothetical protein